jgi:hypothetical protein
MLTCLRPYPFLRFTRLIRRFSLLHHSGMPDCPLGTSLSKSYLDVVADMHGVFVERFRQNASRLVPSEAPTGLKITGEKMESG